MVLKRKFKTFFSEILLRKKKKKKEEEKDWQIKIRSHKKFSKKVTSLTVNVGVYSSTVSLGKI